MLPVSTDGFMILPISMFTEFTLEPVIGVATAIVFDPILEQLVATDSNLHARPVVGRVYWLGNWRVTLATDEFNSLYATLPLMIYTV